jgi:DNA-binding NarL/FixJ family response regulator
MKKRIVLCDDHDLVTHLLESWLSLDANLEVVAVFNRGLELLERLDELRPDIIVQDLQLPDVSGIEVIRRVRELYPETRIYALTGRSDLARAALETGAHGCMLKEENPEELLRALRSELKAGVWLSPMLAAHFFKANAAYKQYKLTATEITALTHLNRTNAEIALQMGLSEGRVRNVVSSVYQKIGVENREDAIQWARNTLLLTYDDQSPVHEKIPQDQEAEGQITEARRAPK